MHTVASGAFDQQAYKAGQLKGWTDTAEGWRVQHDVTERQCGFVSERLIALAGVKAGDSVLDIASGIGEPALAVAALVGPAGHVVATDLSPAMLAISRDRAAKLGLTNMEFHEMDAEAIDLPEGSFNAVVCRFGLMFLPNIEKALKDIHGVLLPGGRLAATTASVPEKNPLVGLVGGAIAKALNITPAPPPAGTPGMFALSDPARIEQLLHGAGFVGARTEVTPFMLDFVSGEELATWQFSISAPVSQMLSGQSNARRQAAWRALADAANQHADSHGRVKLSGENVDLVAERSHVS